MLDKRQFSELMRKYAARGDRLAEALVRNNILFDNHDFKNPNETAEEIVNTLQNQSSDEEFDVILAGIDAYNKGAQRIYDGIGAGVSSTLLGHLMGIGAVEKPHNFDSLVAEDNDLRLGYADGLVLGRMTRVPKEVIIDKAPSQKKIL